MPRGFPSVSIMDTFWDNFKEYCLKRPKYPSPLESWALFAHCPVTLFFFWCLFFAILKGYFSDEAISCISQGGGLEPLMDPIRLLVCSQYSHIELDNGSRGFVLAYPWHPYIFLGICAIMYLPKLVKNLVGHELLEKFLESLEKEEEESRVEEKVIVYCKENVGSHEGQLMASLKISLTCLLTDLVAIFILDTAALHAFYSSVQHLWSFSVPDWLFFQAFPPTVKCSITPTMQVALLNTENYGCSLPLNWFYEKIYILLFVYFCILTPVSILSLLIDLWNLLACRRQAWVSMGGQYVNWTNMVANQWRSDELYILNYFKKLVSLNIFVAIMEEVLAIQTAIFQLQDLPRQHLPLQDLPIFQLQDLPL